jgi:hypothetical protein
MTCREKFPFGHYLQIIDGIAALTINDKKFSLYLGEGIIILVCILHQFNVKVKFKMISALIKSGYEGFTVANKK